MKPTCEHIIAYYHLIKVHPEDWNDRANILKEKMESCKNAYKVYFRSLIPFVHCLNCKKDLSDEELESVATGNDENCPKCGKMLIEWKKSTDIGLEWMTEPSMSEERILFEEWKKIRRTVHNQWPSFRWNTAATDCTDGWRNSWW